MVFLQPVLGAMHMAWADHQHRFNPALGLYEDVVLSGRNSRASSTPSTCPESVQTAERFRGQTVSFTICLTSKHIQARCATSADGYSVFRDDGTQQTVREIIRVPRAQTPLFMTAPKQSPPAVSC
jgi:hypothetical protein